MEKVNLNQIIEILKDFQETKEFTYKKYEDTYKDGWLDACNEILWAIENKCKK